MFRIIECVFSCFECVFKAFELIFKTFEHKLLSGCVNNFRWFF